MSVRDEPLRWALIADDLTGAADTAVEFCEAGFATAVCLSVDAVSRCEAEICAVTTHSRELASTEAVAKVLDASRTLKAVSRRLVFKKIDSLMRGNVVTETEALVREWDFDHALMSPALPRLGRRCSSGVLHTQEGSDIELPVGELLKAPDAETEADLEALAAEVLVSRVPTLVAGSSGLGSAWAEALGTRYGRVVNQSPPPRLERPTLCLIGSVHSRTVVQMDQTLAAGVLVEATLADAADTKDGAARLVRVPVADVDDGWKELLRKTIETNWFGSLVLSGGSTAELVLSALGADLIEIGGSTTAGAPWGTVRGGLADSLIVVTKSGAFGESDELTRILTMLDGKEFDKE